MSAVWRIARAAVRRRRVQTAVIGVVVAVSTGTIVLALGLLVSASGPFQRAMGQQDGAHLVVAYDTTQVSDARLAATAQRPGVEAAAGPFGQVTLDTARSTGARAGSLTTVGRADPAGAVDRLDVWAGKWATAPGEIVLNAPRGTTDLAPLGARFEIPGEPALTVVGFAYSVSASADAWVTPAQLTALKPSTAQMLYRFTQAATAADVDAGRAAVTAGLPAKAVLGGQSYLAVEQRLDSDVGLYVPFLVPFGILGLAVAVLIVANVVSGAVVSGFRDIGVLKSLGFTPNQVMGVYLLMVLVPAALGCVVGTIGGNLVAGPILADAFGPFGLGDAGIDAWVDVVALAGLPLVVAAAALVSALRARRLPATAAISAGSGPRFGRALTIQRRLAGLRLPRSVSLGLGVPFARPARSVLTLAAIVLGVLTVTLSIGVTLSVNAYNSAMRPVHTDRVEFLAGLPGDVQLPPDAPGPHPAPTLSDAADEAMLRSAPGSAGVAATSERTVHLLGSQENPTVVFSRGDGAALGPEIIEGRWAARAGEAAAPSRFLNQRGLKLGDTVTLELGGRRAQVTFVGVTLTNNADTIYADWATLDLLAPGSRADSYDVQLASGASADALVAAVQGRDPGLAAAPPRDGTSSQAVVLVSSASVLTLVLAIVAALGVFNTVVLNAHERRRDLGMLKAIGMTPRQVTIMMVTSTAALGVVGGLLGVPLGFFVHRLVGPAMLRAAQSDVFGFVIDVYRAPALVALGLAGVVIAVLGAVIPAGRAARLPIAAVLHSE
ncbi:ABC transporter permease [Amycolatopsis rhabdoformis]|uniref:ABC transporter permease n=1 Tax=Amycolatopsis rhabdoformis TaxID=1448059 RepID=A0ABZ1ID71_9PSEU|nr:ABC transporter permease [Amycolatopsis rhabdoformis]WSE31862.1 ABC transporter permease [Amycolatopsis rhabdoformis]